MICFFCKECGRRVSVSDEYAGKRGNCPDCGNEVHIPKSHVPVEIQLETANNPLSENYERSNEKLKQEFFNDRGIKPIGLANLNAGKRTKPWYIDIFLYPVSTSGIINLVMLTLFPPLFTIIAMALFQVPVLSFFGFFFLMFKFILRVYFFWCIAECVRYSCLGETRAPSVFSTSGEDLWDGINFYFSIFMSYILCFAWAPISLTVNHQFGVQYWSLTAAGCLFFPILFLAIVVIDSISAWNPLTLIISMIRLMPQYFIVSAGLFVLIWITHQVIFWMLDLEGFARSSMPVTRTLVEIPFVYFSFIAAHLLGRFYWRNADKLDW